jgi:uncharacterized membrane protein
MKICPKCGTEVEKRFWPDCGTEYVEPVEAEVVETEEKVVEMEAEIVETDCAAEETEAPAEAAEAEAASYEVRQEIVPVPGSQREYQEEGKAGKTGKFSAKSTGIVAYVGWIGLIIALLLGDKEGAKFHLNQALVIYLASIIFSIGGSLVPFIGGLIAFAGSIFTLVCWGVGLYYAITQQEKEVPLIGQIKLL